MTTHWRASRYEHYNIIPRFTINNNNNDNDERLNVLTLTHCTRVARIVFPDGDGSLRTVIFPKKPKQNCGGADTTRTVPTYVSCYRVRNAYITISYAVFTRHVGRRCLIFPIRLSASNRRTVRRNDDFHCVPVSCGRKTVLRPLAFQMCPRTRRLFL